MVAVVVAVGVGVVLTLALDPGLEYAVAVGQDGQLVAAYFRPPLPGPWRPDEVVVEFPKYYEGGAPANKIIELAFSAGIQAGNLGCGPLTLPKRVPTVALPKTIVAARVLKILTVDELGVLKTAMKQTPKAMQDNVVDAVRHLMVHYRRMIP